MMLSSPAYWEYKFLARHFPHYHELSYMLNAGGRPLWVNLGESDADGIDTVYNLIGARYANDLNHHGLVALDIKEGRPSQAIISLLGVAYVTAANRAIEQSRPHWLDKSRYYCNDGGEQ
jgi:hypothetical protein